MIPKCTLFRTGVQASAVAAAAHTWRDGEPEPRVSTLRLRDLAPNYRCITYGDRRTYVEVPYRWQRDVSDPDVRAAVREAEVTLRRSR